MEKLEYDSLHKFQVSLGLIFIALPFILLGYFFNNEIDLINSTEFEALSTYSQTQLQYKEYIINVFLATFPIISTILFILGGKFLHIGIKNWEKVQNDIDGVIAADRLKHELDAEQMKQSEVLKRTIEEIKETESTKNPEQSVIMNHMDIEELYFRNAIPTHIRRRYFFKRNLKIGEFEYDGIALSKKDNIDLIYEIKFWKRPMPLQALTKYLEHLYEAGINYERTKYRNFSCILVLVTTNENIEKMRKLVNSFLIENKSNIFPRLEIQCIAEKDLFYPQ